jgi:hypothetical protein
MKNQRQGRKRRFQVEELERRIALSIFSSWAGNIAKSVDAVVVHTVATGLHHVESAAVTVVHKAATVEHHAGSAAARGLHHAATGLHHAESAAGSGLHHAESAVARGLHHAGSAAARGLHHAGSGLHHAESAVARGLHHAGSAAARGLHGVARGLHHAGSAVARGLHHAESAAARGLHHAESAAARGLHHIASGLHHAESAAATGLHHLASGLHHARSAAATGLHHLASGLHHAESAAATGLHQDVGVVKGVYKGLKGMVEGIGTLAKDTYNATDQFGLGLDPAASRATRDKYKELASMIRNDPGKLVDGVIKDYKDAIKHGEYGEALGRLLVDVGLIFIPGAGEVGEAANAAGKAGEAANAVSKAGEAGEAANAASKAGEAADTIPLWRAVQPAELSDIQATGTLRNPIGVETKYFASSPQGAASYANQAVTAFGDAPYDFVRTEIATSSLNPENFVQVDRGIETIVLTTEQLKNLSPPEILTYIEFAK